MSKPLEGLRITELQVGTLDGETTIFAQLENEDGIIVSGSLPYIVAYLDVMVFEDERMKEFR